MAAEVEEKYYLENGLPDYQVTPKPIEEFYQKYGHYPAKVIVNLAHKVKWSEYFIPIPTQHAPSIQPLEIKDIDATMAQGYHIPIEYDKRVDEKTLVCGGFARLIKTS